MNKNDILYFDLLAGASGDMIVSSLLDLTGENLSFLKKELKKIDLKDYSISFLKCQAAHIQAHRFVVKDHISPQRTLQFNQIQKKIKSSKLSLITKNRILSIFEKLYLAEKEVHGKKDVHFHQLGEIDSIIDISASCILIEKINVGQISYSSVPFGKRVAPATTQLLKTKQIYFSGHPYENITPTGIAIITTLGTQKCQSNPDEAGFYPQKIGYGCGSVKIENYDNLLRTMLLSENPGLKTQWEKDRIMLIQCNIDDMAPNLVGYVMDKLYENNALEVSLQNYHTKKSRIGILISVLSKPENLVKIAGILFKETTTLGVRYSYFDRLKLKREERVLNTSIGKIRYKQTQEDKSNKTIWEYDDCVKAARGNKMPLREVIGKLEKISFKK